MVRKPRSKSQPLGGESLSKTEKIYHLHEILSSRRTPIARADLMDRLECSQATLYRLIASLRDELGAPIEQDDESRFYYDRDLGSFELPGIWLSAEQISALVSARSLLRRVQPGLLDEELGALSDRITSLLSGGSEGRDLDRLIRIVHQGGRRAPREVFRAVLDALVRDRRLGLQYRSRTDDVLTERVVSPQRLTCYRENWYLDGWCHLRNGLRSFALEQIESIESVDEPRKSLADEELNTHFQSAYGIFAGPAVETAILEFSARSARWVADELWHSRQVGKWLDDGRYRLEVPFGHTEELVMDLMKYGAEVDVKSPESLRQAVRDGHREAMERY